MIADEQAEFAELLRRLTPEQWETSSLCTKWTVRETVLHVTNHVHTKDVERLVQLARARFSETEMHARLSRKDDELIAWLESPAVVDSDNNARVQLSELVIHQQDVRRPLGMPRAIPADRLTTVLDYGLTRIGGSFAVAGARRRAKALRLVATDMSWFAGTGPEVRGPGEALFMAISGRADALSDLSGEGVELLGARAG
jgi:uncharacterized protein (TIGR03083 family)